MMHASRWGAVLAMGMLLSASALAQDAHYNTRQFGNRAWLLGGAFVGNPDDISAVYYNPGALGLLGAPELELTGSVYEYTHVSVVDGAGEGWDLYHAATGLHFLVGRSRFTLGTNLAWGGKSSQRLSEALQQAGVDAPVQSHSIRYFQATVLLGASFSLLDKRQTGGEAGAGDDSDAEAK
ncbi:MAG: hypothetical protein EOO71_06155 [Myxococcaceae bacterium]|nr:MAG: hypothetical protein EOO71_06155 [Myxococcaceae bacterium]